MSCSRRTAWGSTPISGTPYFRPASTRLLTRWVPLRVCSAARLRVTLRLGAGRVPRAAGAGDAAAAAGVGGALAAPAAGVGELGSAGAVSAALGRGTAIGALAVPPTWTVVPPTMSPLSGLSGAALGGMPPASPPAVAAGIPGMPAANAAGNRFGAATPRYGLRPTVRAHPPSAG